MRQEEAGRYGAQQMVLERVLGGDRPCFREGCDRPSTGRHGRFCSDACRAAQWRADVAAKEEALKDRGMKVAADKRPDDLQEARRLAQLLWDVGRRPVSIDDVREAAEAEGRRLDFSRNWVGSVFRGWVFCGTCKARHEGSHGRRISLWRKP